MYVHHALHRLLNNRMREASSWDDIPSFENGYHGPALTDDEEATVSEACEHRYFRPEKDLNEQDEHGHTPLHKVAALGSARLVSDFLEQGAWMMASGPLGETPLMMAAANNHSHVVQLLIAHGANPDEGSQGLPKALHRAAGNGHQAMVNDLMDGGANPEARDHRHRTAVDVARGAQQNVIANGIERRVLTSFVDSLALAGAELLDPIVPHPMDPTAGGADSVASRTEPTDAGQVSPSSSAPVRRRARL